MKYMGTIITSLVLLGIVIAIVLKIRRDRKKSCTGCSCRCGKPCG